jgi:hypothetical protein
VLRAARDNDTPFLTAEEFDGLLSAALDPVRAPLSRPAPRYALFRMAAVRVCGYDLSASM